MAHIVSAEYISDCGTINLFCEEQQPSGLQTPGGNYEHASAYREPAGCQRLAAHLCDQRSGLIKIDSNAVCKQQDSNIGRFPEERTKSMAKISRWTEPLDRL